LKKQTAITKRIPKVPPHVELPKNIFPFRVGGNGSLEKVTQFLKAGKIIDPIEVKMAEFAGDEFPAVYFTMPDGQTYALKLADIIPPKSRKTH
jgi:hypothetical protein